MKTKYEQLEKYSTNEDNLLFIGYDGYEEFYLNMDSDFTGWSFMGLRPNTEQELRDRQREVEPEEYFEMPDWASTYFDYERWYNDQEEQWYESHDVQAERENEDGETLYLGFGTGTNIKHYFKEHNIIDFESYKEHFEIVGLNGREFAELKNKVGF